MEMIEKVAFLKGLAEGLGIDDNTKEGKVLGLVIDLLDDIVPVIVDVSEEVDAVRDELDDLAEDIYAGNQDECGCGCEEEFGFEGELYEVVCPACADIVCVDEDMLDEGEISCPACGQTLEFDLEGSLDSEELDSTPD